MFFNIVGLFAAISWLRYTLAEDLPAIEVHGNKFFYSNNGTRFFLKGVAYQQDSAGAKGSSKLQDPLGSYSICSRDIPYLQKLSTNVIRVYALNVSLDHSQCMKALNDAGIYVIADLSEPDASINREQPSWDVELYKRYTSVIDMMHNYTNVLGFFAGNEVTNNSTNTEASAFVKAAVRDSKAYIKKMGYRKIPVGYSTNDDADTRVAMVDYFLCGSDEERADFYGVNMYEWCGKSTFQTSGYADRTKELSHVNVPLFFSEYGCNEVRPRPFTEVGALYGDQMIDVWSGGIVYMYFEEENKYGLVEVNNNNVSPLPDFTSYSNEIKKVTPTALNSKSYATSDASITCPATDTNWAPSPSLPPTPNEELCSCMSNSLSCVVNDNVKETEYEALFNYVCAHISCDGINANSTAPHYGSYSFCSSKEQLSFVLDAYYKANGQSSGACSFQGSATLKKATTASSCASALQAVGSAGTGSFTGSLAASNSGKASSSAATGKGETAKASGTSKPSSNAAAVAGSFAFESNLSAWITCAAVLTTFGAMLF